MSPLLKTWDLVQPGICDGLAALFSRCPGACLFDGSLTVGMYSVPGGAVAPEDEGGQPGFPLTAVLPDAANRLWTTSRATAALSSTG